MTVTREQAIAELKRRGVAIPGQFNEFPKITKEMAAEELKRRGVAIPGQQSMLPQEPQGFAAIVQDALSGLLDIPNAVGSGIAALPQLPEEIYGAGKQVITDPVRALQNVGQGIVDLGQIPGNIYPNIRDYLRKRGITRQESPDIVNAVPRIDIGELTGRGEKIPGDALISLIGGNAPLAGLGAFASPLRTAGTLGAQALGHNENPLTAAGLGFGGHLAGKGIASGLKGLPGISKTQAINDFYRRYNKGENVSSKLFGDVLRTAEKANVKVQFPEMDIRRLSKLPNEAYKAIENFFEHETPTSAHDAYKQLGKSIRNLKKKQRKEGELNFAEGKRLDAAMEAQKSILDSMYTGFEEASLPELSQGFATANKHWLENVKPYKHHEEMMHSFEKGELTPYDFIKGVTSNKKYKAQLSEHHPAMNFARNLYHPAALIGGGAFGAGYLGKKLISELLGNRE